MSLNQLIRYFLTTLDYEKLLANKIQSISIKLITETGPLVRFLVTGKLIQTLLIRPLPLKWILTMLIKQSLCLISLDINANFFETEFSHSKDAKMSGLPL